MRTRQATGSGGLPSLAAPLTRRVGPRQRVAAAVAATIALSSLVAPNPANAATPVPTYTVTSHAHPYPGLSSGTTLVLTGDDDYAPVGLPFAAPFYGGAYSTVWVDTKRSGVLR